MPAKPKAKPSPRPAAPSKYGSRKQRLTQASVAALAPEHGAYEIRDTALPGFAVRVEASGIKSYKAMFGRRTRTIGRSNVMPVAAAREEARRWLMAWQSGRDAPLDQLPTAPGSARTPTLAQFIEDRYDAHLRAHARDADGMLDRIARMPFGPTPLDRIDPSAVDAWRTKRLAAGASKATINRDVGALRAALSRAVEWELIELHPLARLKPLPIDRKGRTRFLSDAEVQRFLTALEAPDPQRPAYLRPAVMLMLYAGLRRGEALGLRMRDVDLSRNTLMVAGHRAKSGQTRHVPMNPALAATMRDFIKAHRLADLPDARLFEVRSIRRSWSRLMKQAGLDAEVTPHVLRHSFASHLVMSGAPIRTVQSLLGHSTVALTERYSHLAPEHMQAAVDRLPVLTATAAKPKQKKAAAKKSSGKTGAGQKSA